MSSPTAKILQMMLFVCSLLLLQAGIGPQASPRTSLDRGFDNLYNLSFAAAHRNFANWEKQHPDDPRAPVFDAAVYLFSEFDRLRILQSQFFVSDDSYSDLKKRKPDPAIKMKFEEALAKGEQLATAKLKQTPNDSDSLFANVLRMGLHSNYLALIQKQNLAALNEVKRSREAAEDLIKLHPDCYDAYIAVGIENYLLSLKAAPVRWLLHATGAQTDRETGVAKLRLTATKGHYLKPYAELLLAVAALRGKDNQEARRYLSDLATRFPRNPLYREELEKIH